MSKTKKRILIATGLLVIAILAVVITLAAGGAEARNVLVSEIAYIRDRSRDIISYSDINEASNDEEYKTFFATMKKPTEGYPVTGVVVRNGKTYTYVASWAHKSANNDLYYSTLAYAIERQTVDASGNAHSSSAPDYRDTRNTIYMLTENNTNAIEDSNKKNLFGTTISYDNSMPMAHVISFVDTSDGVNTYFLFEDNRIIGKMQATDTNWYQEYQNSTEYYVKFNKVVTVHDETGYYGAITGSTGLSRDNTADFTAVTRSCGGLTSGKSIVDRDRGGSWGGIESFKTLANALCGGFTSSTYDGLNNSYHQSVPLKKIDTSYYYILFDIKNDDTTVGQLSAAQAGTTLATQYGLTHGTKFYSLQKTTSGFTLGGKSYKYVTDSRVTDLNHGGVALIPNTPTDIVPKDLSRTQVEDYARTHSTVVRRYLNYDQDLRNEYAINGMENSSMGKCPTYVMYIPVEPVPDPTPTPTLLVKFVVTEDDDRFGDKAGDVLTSSISTNSKLKVNEDGTFTYERGLTVGLTRGDTSVTYEVCTDSASWGAYAPIIFNDTNESTNNFTSTYTTLRSKYVKTLTPAFNVASPDITYKNKTGEKLEKKAILVIPIKPVEEAVSLTVKYVIAEDKTDPDSVGKILAEEGLASNLTITGRSYKYKSSTTLVLNGSPYDVCTASSTWGSYPPVLYTSNGTKIK